MKNQKINSRFVGLVFSIWLWTGSNPEEINRLRSHTENEIIEIVKHNFCHCIEICELKAGVI